MFVLFYVLRHWLGFLPAGGMQVVGFLCIQAAQESGHPKYSQTEMWVANLLAAGVLLVIAYSQGELSVFLLAIFGNGSGYWEASIFELFNTVRNVYCLSQLNLDKIFARISK